MALHTRESLTLPVLGMTCASCQHHVEAALRETAGVESARVDLMAHRASVVFDPALAAPQQLVEAIREAGYDAVLPRARDTGSPARDRAADSASSRKAWVTLAAGAVAMLLAMPLGAEMGAVDHALMRLVPWLYVLPAGFLRWFLLLMTAMVVAWAGRGIYVSAIRALRHGATNMNTLVSLGTGVAFVFSAYATLAPAAGRQIYFDAVLLILGFLLLGKSLEVRAKRRALAALDSLSRLRPATARRVVDGAQAVVPLAEIQVGDSILVLPGERFPVDAAILEGRTTVDESMLTGESRPLEREPGGRVLAGSLNYDGAVVCRAESLGEATVLAQIARMEIRRKARARPWSGSQTVPARSSCRWCWFWPLSRLWRGSLRGTGFHLRSPTRSLFSSWPAHALWGWPFPPRSPSPWAAARSSVCCLKAARRSNVLPGWRRWMRLCSTRPERSPWEGRC